MWHASVKSGTMEQSEALAESALEACGDERSGQWKERGNGVFHLRRRLSEDECKLAGNLTVNDLRNTASGKRKLAFLFHDAPHLRGIAQQIGEAA